MSKTPRTDEAIERWHQGKVNILEELAKLEIDLNAAVKAEREALAKMCQAVAEADNAERERIDLAKQLRSEKEMHAACQNERDELKQKTGYWESLIHWLEQVQKAFEGKDRDWDLTQVYMRGPFAGWSESNMVKFADELWENEQKYPLRGDKK